jgi:transposase
LRGARFQLGKCLREGARPANRVPRHPMTARLIADQRDDLVAVRRITTVSAIRRNPIIGAFYQRLRASGHPAKVAITAAMRKLITILNAILRDHRPWQPA